MTIETEDANSSPQEQPSSAPLQTFSTQAIEPWILPLQKTWATNSIIAINVLIFLTMVLDGGLTTIWKPDSELLLKWQLDWGPLTLDGEPWRLLTSTFTHIGIIHLGCNMAVLSRIGATCELLYGRAKFLTIYLLSGIGASVCSLMIHADNGSAGASGAICGLIGAYAGFILMHQKEIEPKIFKESMKQIAVYLAVCVIFGASVNADQAAHAGGLLAGLALGAAMAPTNNTDRSIRLRDAFGTIAVIGLIGWVFTLEVNGAFDRSGMLAFSKANNAINRDKNIAKAIELLESPQAAQSDSLYVNQLRASLYLKTNQIEKAKQAVEKLLKQVPDNPTVLQLAMEVAFIDRDYPKTIEITNKAIEATKEKEPQKAAYFAFTNYLASKRLGVKDAAEKLKLIKEKLSAEDWAYKVASYLDGSMNETAFAAAAQNNDQTTEVQFYTAMMKLSDGETAEAKKRFEWVVKNGPSDFIEYHYSLAELANLNADKIH
jgi:membrane associated rhomboid family serine protease